MLQAIDIHKNFDRLHILKGIHLEVLQGEVVSIVGPSGAGKTTLLQILGTLDKPTKGEIRIDNVNPFSLSEKKLSAFRNQNIGFIFQFHQLLPEFTAVENVILPALIKGKSKKEAIKYADQLFDILGIGKRKTHRPSELSGGEQQRFAVARALINEPKIIFADEPSGNLDSKNSEELHQLFFDLRDQLNQTFVIVTHNKQLANMTDKTFTMKDGLIITE